MDLHTLPKPEPPLPERPRESGCPESSLADRVEQLIRQRTSGLVRELKISLLPGEVLVTGRATTYYAKQLATHAALEACEHLTLTNDIEVY